MIATLLFATMDRVIRGKDVIRQCEKNNYEKIKSKIIFSKMPIWIYS